jgi:hypothetical protein
MAAANLPTVKLLLTPSFDSSGYASSLSYDFDLNGSRTSYNNDDKLFIPGSADALMKDQGGLIGPGRAFLSLPSGLDGDYQVTIDWDLSGAPTGTAAVCSYGESTNPVTVVGKASDVLLNCVFMVGPVQRYPAQSSLLESSDAASPPSDGFAATYWFGSALPIELANLTDYHTKIFPRVSGFFRDGRANYRCFLRRMPNGRLRGSGFRCSSIIDYGDDIGKIEEDYDIVRVMTQQIVASLISLDIEDDGEDNSWLRLGITLPCLHVCTEANSL